LVSSVDCICKCLDDATLAVPDNSDFRLEDGWQYVMRWSIQNRLISSLAETKEMIFRRPSSRPLVDPPLPDNIERVAAFKLVEHEHAERAHCLCSQPTASFT
jgi:hypothetical protein